MRAVTIEKAGGTEVLTVTDHPVRAAGAGEVRIAVKAAAINPTDILMREKPEVYAKGSPGIPGMDAAGVIESVGEGVERLKVGDEVMAVVTPRRPEGGAQIELLVVPAASVVPIPSGATLAQASTLPMNGLTARLALDLIKLSPRSDARGKRRRGAAGALHDRAGQAAGPPHHRGREAVGDGAGAELRRRRRGHTRRPVRQG